MRLISLVSTDSLRAEHRARLHELKVTAAVGSDVSRLASTSGELLRVLQWNILADGLSDDGFLVGDVLAEVEGEVAVDAAALAEELQALRKAKADLEPLRVKTSTPRAQRNVVAVIDWDLRWARMREVIALLQPDVITMQELDHFADAVTGLAALGYEAGPGVWTAPQCAGFRHSSHALL